MRASIVENGFSFPKDVTLPASAREKIFSLQLVAEDRHALSIAAHNRHMEAYENLLAKRREVEQLQRDFGNGRLMRRERVGKFDQVSADRSQVDQAEKAIAKLVDQEAKASHLSSVRSDRAGEIRGILNAIQNWLKGLPSPTVLVERPAPKAKASKALYPERIADLRAEIDQLAPERERVVSAPKQSNDAKARARAHVMELAEKGRPDVSGLIYGNGSVEYTRHFEHAMRANVPVRIYGDIDALALTAWLDPERLIARLEAEIDEESDDEFALADDDRAARLIEIDADRLELERQEEAVIAMAEEAGQEVPRRTDASPLAILGLEIKAPSTSGKAA